MFRLKLLLIIGGGAVAFLGFQEFRVSSGASATPVDANLAEIESGGQAANKHVKFSEPVALYGACVYEYKQGEYDKGPPNAGTKVNYCYCPIISNDHPYVRGWDALVQKYGSIDAIPQSEPGPQLQDFAVMVKTRQFKTIGTIPDGIRNVPSIKGLITNEIDGLDDEEQQLVRSSFPGVNFEKLLIVEQDREPASLGKSLGMTIGGAILALMGVGWMFKREKTEEAPVTESEPEPEQTA